MPEPGRQIVQAGISPVAQPVLFAEACIVLALSDFDGAPEGITLFDRSFLDAVVFLERQGALSDAMRARIGARRYDDTVLMAPPWPEIFQQDAERGHSYQAALAEHDALCQRLPEMGYRCVTLPKDSVAGRVGWLEAALRQEERQPA